MLDEALLEQVEEFLEQIAATDEDLEFSIDSLREFLERHTYGAHSADNRKVAYAVQCRLEEIWDLVPSREKSTNPDLNEYFEDLMHELEEVSDFETEGSCASDEIAEGDDWEVEEDGEEC